MLCRPGRITLHNFFFFFQGTSTGALSCYKRRKSYCVPTWDWTCYPQLGEPGFYQLGYWEGVDWAAHASVLKLAITSHKNRKSTILSVKTLVFSLHADINYPFQSPKYILLFVIGSEKRDHLALNAKFPSCHHSKAPRALFLVYEHFNLSTKEIQRYKVFSDMIILQSLHYPRWNFVPRLLPVWVWQSRISHAVEKRPFHASLWSSTISGSSYCSFKDMHS